MQEKTVKENLSTDKNSKNQISNTSTSTNSSLVLFDRNSDNNLVLNS